MSQISQVIYDRKEKLLEFIKELVTKLLDEGYLEAEDPNRPFKMKTFDDQNENQQSESYELSMEIKYLFHEIINMNRSKYKSQDAIYPLRVVLEVLFNEVSRNVREYQINLMPYLGNMKMSNKVQKILNELHKYNISNILDCLQCYISGKEAFKNKEVTSIEIEKLNNELKIFSQNTIEELYLRINPNGRDYRPVYSQFLKLMDHSYTPEGIKVTLTLENILKVANVCFENKK